MSWGAGFIEERSGEKGGKIKFKFSPQKTPPRIQDLGGNRGCNCKEPGEGIMAGQVQRVQVASRPPPLVGRPSSKGSLRESWSATHIGGLPCVHNITMWSKPRKSELGERKPNFSEGFKRVRNNCWPAMTYWWPPRCVQHKYVVEGQRKWPGNGQHQLSSEENGRRRAMKE